MIDLIREESNNNKLTLDSDILSIEFVRKIIISTVHLIIDLMINNDESIRSIDRTVYTQDYTFRINRGDAKDRLLSFIIINFNQNFPILNEKMRLKGITINVKNHIPFVAIKINDKNITNIFMSNSDISKVRNNLISELTEEEQCYLILRGIKI